MTNLLKEPPVAHRQLFITQKNSRTPRTEYFIEDLWRYWNLCWLGRKNKVALGAFTTREELKEAEENLLKSAEELTDKDKELLLRYISSTKSVEVVLFAIDSYMSEVIDSPNVYSLQYYLRSAQIKVSRIIIDHKTIDN